MPLAFMTPAAYFSHPLSGPWYFGELDLGQNIQFPPKYTGLEYSRAMQSEAVLSGVTFLSVALPPCWLEGQTWFQIAKE